jgi:hypothetical protein
MEQTTCHECGAVVGGANHTLAAGNVRFDPTVIAATD